MENSVKSRGIREKKQAKIQTVVSELDLLFHLLWFILKFSMLSFQGSVFSEMVETKVF